MKLEFDEKQYEVRSADLDGMSQEQLDEMNRKLEQDIPAGQAGGRHSGIGVANVNARIKLMFGRQYGIRYRSVLGSGTDAIIRMSLRKISKFGFINFRKADELTSTYVRTLEIKTPSVKQEVKNLSGGNQQKVVVAKVLAADNEVLIFDEPTRGIDVGAKQEIYMSIFGVKVAVAYVIVGLIVAVTGGTIIEHLHLENEVEDFIRNARAVGIDSPTLTQMERLAYAKDQMVSTFRKVFPYILIGVGIGAVIHNWIPESWVEAVLGSQSRFGVVLATLIGVPMYADIFGTIPIAEALLYKGAQLGTVLSFMAMPLTVLLVGSEDCFLEGWNACAHGRLDKRAVFGQLFDGNPAVPQNAFFAVHEGDGRLAGAGIGVAGIKRQQAGFLLQAGNVDAHLALRPDDDGQFISPFTIGEDGGLVLAHALSSSGQRTHLHLYSNIPDTFPV